MDCPQVAHPLVRDQLIKFIYTGFLLPVLGPALHQVRFGWFPSPVSRLALGILIQTLGSGEGLAVPLQAVTQLASWAPLRLRESHCWLGLGAACCMDAFGGNKLWQKNLLKEAHCYCVCSYQISVRFILSGTNDNLTLFRAPKCSLKQHAGGVCSTVLTAQGKLQIRGHFLKNISVGYYLIFEISSC